VPKKKLIHFAENLTFPFLFQPHYQALNEGFIMKGSWKSSFFRNFHKITIELGCGKGEYTIALAQRYPDRNFIGVDIKGARLWRGCRSVIEHKLSNVAFIRTRVDHIEKFFEPSEVGEIWITFPDPQTVKERKRLTSPRFMEYYRNILSADGVIHLKTDYEAFFEYTLQVIRELGMNLIWSTSDLYRSGCTEDVMAVQTHYEKIWLAEGKKIHYLCCNFI
jgi:tRNA (guanine-N7-)-methyltransferase